MDSEIEFIVWEEYISQLLKKYPMAPIYLNGGSVLGLECLRQIVNKCNKDNFMELYNKFIRLGLIKDWDFVIQCENFDCQIDPRIKKEGSKNMVIMRYQKEQQRLMIGSNALFELSVLNQPDTLSTLELPLTSMKILLTPNNLKDILILIRKIYWNIPIDLSYLRHIFQICPILIDECTTNGLFKLTQSISLDPGDLSVQMLDLMKPIGDDEVYQFLISQLARPCRFFLRLVEKNIDKSEKIRQFFIEHKIDLPLWLLNKQYIECIKKTLWIDLKIAIGTISEKHTNKLESVKKWLDIINLKINLLKYNDTFTNMIDGLINGSINLYLIDILKNCSDEEINQKLLEFRIQQTKCATYGIEENHILISDRKVRKNTIRKLNKEKIKYTDTVLEPIYIQLLTELSELFKGVNIGRLCHQIDKFSQPTQLEVVNFFGSILQSVNGLPPPIPKQPYGKFVYLIQILFRIQSTSEIDCPIVF
jgi:hypothetical protein